MCMVVVGWFGPIATAFADEPAAPAPDDAAHAESAPLADKITKLEARLAQLEAASDAALAATTETKEPTFRLYGFIDMGVQKLWSRDDKVLPTREATFVLGNINLYFDFHPATDWSSLVEVRFTNYPSGSGTDTTVQDPGNGDGHDTVQLGSIVLERAYMQWQHDARLGVRVGQFLTPYGIWNVDHGTPTLIALFRPKFESNQMFPEHQLGVELFGRFDDVLPNRWELDYHAYVSNGRTPGVVDIDQDKMIGFRLAASTTRPVPVTIGISGLRGRFTEQQRVVDANSLSVTRIDTVAARESALALDASVDVGAWRLRGEAALNHREYDRDKRALSWVPGVYIADEYQADVYVLAAYRIPHTRFEPFAYGEAYYWPTPLGEDYVATAIGVTTYFTHAIQLKAEYSHSAWMDGRDRTLVASPAHEDFVAAKLVMGL